MAAPYYSRYGRDLYRSFRPGGGCKIRNEPVGKARRYSVSGQGVIPYTKAPGSRAHHMRSPEFTLKTYAVAI